MPRRFLHSLSHALGGIRYAWSEERNVRIQMILAVIVIIAMLMLDFTATEFALIALAIALVIGTELLNTVVEDVLDVIEPGHHPIVGRAKDLMAAVVLINSLTAALIGAAVLAQHFT